MSNRLGKFLALPWCGRRLLIEAAFALGAARLVLALLPFRRIAARLGRAGEESADTIPPALDSIAEQVGWAAETMARHLPWESSCLAKALSAWWMMGRRGIAGTVYFGVARNPGRPFDAHAWLRCGTRIVTGGEGQEGFAVLAMFARGAEVPKNKK